MLRGLKEEVVSFSFY